MSTDDEIRVRFTVTKDEALKYLNHQQSLTAAREAVVEAAKKEEREFKRVLENKGLMLAYLEARDRLHAAVAALRAIEQETSNG